ncbi:hypothetical protein P171DRAFT_232570 [Karstenula rhodostoma CBS 690.94]|uniref:Uncharacterized protein n=1 Tax=Karstenula rhodostoma CBS 690.94 TaxID=1392251 RepID=A0A9P4PMF8_9PLEO|nr:hypothetical protein P171DRAFT_232570 [Karstenula rhodostoma CBS 690.94]
MKTLLDQPCVISLLSTSCTEAADVDKFWRKYGHKPEHMSISENQKHGVNNKRTGKFVPVVILSTLTHPTRVKKRKSSTLLSQQPHTKHSHEPYTPSRSSFPLAHKQHRTHRLKDNTNPTPPHSHTHPSLDARPTQRQITCPRATTAQPSLAQPRP